MKVKNYLVRGEKERNCPPPWVLKFLLYMQRALLTCPHNNDNTFQRCQINSHFYLEHIGHCNFAITLHNPQIIYK